MVYPLALRVLCPRRGDAPNLVAWFILNLKSIPPSHLMIHRKSSSLSAVFVAALAIPLTGFAGSPDPSKEKAVIEKPAEARTKITYLLEGGVSASTGAPNDNQLFGRLFDDRNGEPLLNQATLNIERALAPEPGKFDYGYKLQLTGGSDARFLNPIGELDRLTNNRYTAAVVEAYGNFHLPVFTEGGLDIRVGQFASPMGAEVIYPAGNFFYSHSYLFNFPIPLQHLGVNFTLHVNKMLDVYGAVVRGANVGLDDNNDVQSFLGGFVLTLLDGKVILAANTSIGSENDGSSENTLNRNNSRVKTNSDPRFYNEANLTFKPTDKLTLTTDVVYTRDEAYEAEAYGIAQYVTFSINKYVSVGVRGEIYRDQSGFYTAQFAENDDAVDLLRGDVSHIDVRTVGPGGGTTFAEATIGVNIRPIDHVTIRPELRYDKSLEGRNAFTDSTQSHQFTGGLDVLIQF